MIAKAVFEMIQNRTLFPLLRLSGLLTPFYKLSYIASLFYSDFFDMLAAKSVSLSELVKAQGIGEENQEALKAWLQIGIRLGEIQLSGSGYSLNGISRMLAQVGNDSLRAITQEAASLHHKLIFETPQKLKGGIRWTLNDQEGELIARSSRIIEPFQREVIHTMIAKNGALQLLEVGCGSGIYIKHAADRNPQLNAVGVELQADVVELARRNIASWQLQDRVSIEIGDIRKKAFDRQFDVVTLYNNIYYFPVNERIALLKRLRGLLKSGGIFLLTTGCQGGQPLMELLNLWGASTQGCDRLPYADEMMAQMTSAGFVEVTKKNLLPGDSFYLFTGTQFTG